jgi:Flp pilus assembly protein RcpC/CpaB
MATTSADATRRWLALHRRPVAAGLAFAAVLLALSALSSPSPQAPTDREAGGGISIPDGQLAVPLRLADAAVTSLLQPGDLVDVFAADARSGAEVVASGVTVTATPSTDGGPWAGEEPLVVVLVMPEQAPALAAASAGGDLTVALHPR